MTDDAARERGQWPSGGRTHGEPGYPYDTPAASPPDSSVSGSPYGRPYGADQYGLDQYGLEARPVSGGFAAQPVSGGFAAQPVSGGLGTPPVPQRRIEPSPPRQRGKLILGLIIGLLAGALVAGTGAFFLGRATAGDGRPDPATSVPPALLSGLVATNRAKFPAGLAALAEPWLADMSGCVADTDSGGPQLGQGQRSHVLCRDGGMYLHFVVYASAEAKSTDLAYRQQVALNSASILPGAEQPGRKVGGVTGTAGTYVEYAFRSGKDPALCGVWWNTDNSDAAVYVDVICDSLGGKWDPLRAVWQRHS